MSNEQEDRMTDEMWEAMPNGAHVVYRAGTSYDSNGTPIVAVAVGMHDLTTYSWSVCDVCGCTTWCVSNYNMARMTSHGLGGVTVTCEQHRA